MVAQIFTPEATCETSCNFRAILCITIAFPSYVVVFCTFIVVGALRDRFGVLVFFPGVIDRNCLDPILSQYARLRRQVRDMG
jgi:hypothetical protein